MLKLKQMKLKPRLGAMDWAYCTIQQLMAPAGDA